MSKEVKKHEKSDNSIYPSYVSIIFSWFFGIIFLLGGVGGFISLEIILGLSSLIMGLILLPPMNKLVKNKFDINISRKAKTIIIIIGLLIIGLTDNSGTTHQSSNTITYEDNQVTSTKGTYSYNDEICDFIASYPDENSSVEKTKEEFNLDDVRLYEALNYCITKLREEQRYEIEMSIKDIISEFSDLTELQQKEKMAEFKGKRIRTSISINRVDKATLSTQYVVMQMYHPPYDLIPYAKAFFPAEEKDKLLNLNIGDRLIFSGEFDSYKEGYMTTTVIFTKAHYIGIE